MMLLAVLACLTQAAAQDTFDVTTVGKDPRWQIAGRTASVVDTNGKRALKLEFAPIMGLVWLKGYDSGTVSSKPTFWDRASRRREVSWASPSVWWMGKPTALSTSAPS